MSNADWRNTTARQARVVTNKKGLWLFPLLVFLFVLFSAVLLLVPSFRSWQETKAAIEEQEVKLNQLTEKRKNLESLSLLNLDEKQKLLERVIPNHKPVFEFLIAMEKEASFSGVLLGSYELNPGSLATESAEIAAQSSNETPGELAVLPVELEVQGSLESISDFLKRLEKLAPLVGLTKMDLSLGDVSYQNTEETSDERQVKVSMDLHYALAPKKDSGVSTLATRGFTDADEALFELLRSYTKHELEGIIDSDGQVERENPFEY